MEFRVVQFLLLFYLVLEVLRVLKIAFFGIWCQLSAFRLPPSVPKGVLNNDGDVVGVGRKKLKELIWERGVLR